MNAPWNNEDLRRAFDADFDALVAFASRSKARVGFAFLRADGQVDLGRPLDARISARMTHVFALAQMRGTEGASHLVSHGLAALSGPLRGANGSWYAEVVPTSETSATPVPRAVLSQRAQSAMIGAAAAALMAGHEKARPLLADLEEDQDRRWWDPATGSVREEIEAASGRRSPLRRLSTNLDTAQAYLVAWEATGSRVWFDRARAILRLVGEVAARCGFALPDLYDEEWRPLVPSSDREPIELIRPGDTLPGLGFKAARLIGQTYAILARMGEPPSPWMLDTAEALYDRAHADGWTDRDIGGIVYTLGPDGLVAAPQRMHWVVCEAASAARVLAELADRGVGHVLVEGGPSVTSAFIGADLVDTLVVHEAPLMLGPGAGATDSLTVGTLGGAVHWRLDGPVRVLGEDLEITLRPAPRRPRPRNRQPH